MARQPDQSDSTHGTTDFMTIDWCKAVCPSAAARSDPRYFEPVWLRISGRFSPHVLLAR